MVKAPSTGEWRPATAHEEATIAARTALDAAHLRMLHRCRCEAGPCDNAPEGSVFGKVINQCPWGWARNPHFEAAAYLVRCMDAGPVQGWPDRFAAGIVDTVIAIGNERESWKARQIEGASRG